MMDWGGIEDNATDTDTEDGIFSLENVTFFLRGELGRRMGFGAKISNSGLVAGEIGSYVAFVKANGNIEVESQ
jgi:hypothetical protein